MKLHISINNNALSYNIYVLHIMNYVELFRESIGHSPLCSFKGFKIYDTVESIIKSIQPGYTLCRKPRDSHALITLFVPKLYSPNVKNLNHAIQFTFMKDDTQA